MASPWQQHWLHWGGWPGEPVVVQPKKEEKQKEEKRIQPAMEKRTVASMRTEPQPPPPGTWTSYFKVTKSKEEQRKQSASSAASCRPGLEAQLRRCSSWPPAPTASREPAPATPPRECFAPSGSFTGSKPPGFKPLSMAPSPLVSECHDFRSGLKQLLAGAELYILGEVDKLSMSVASLRKENDLLRRQAPSSAILPPERTTSSMRYVKEGSTCSDTKSVKSDAKSLDAKSDAQSSSHESDRPGSTGTGGAYGRGGLVSPLKAPRADVPPLQMSGLKRKKVDGKLMDPFPGGVKAGDVQLSAATGGAALNGSAGLAGGSVAQSSSDSMGLTNAAATAAVFGASTSERTDELSRRTGNDRGSTNGGSDGKFPDDFSQPWDKKETGVSSNAARNSLWGGDQTGKEQGKLNTSLDVREMLSQKYGVKYHNTDTHRFYKSDGWVQMLARSEYFQYATLFVVVLNSLWIWIDLDYNGKPMLESPPLFQVVETAFLLAFTFEMFVRFFSFRNKLHLCLDPWFIFDASIVVISILENYVFALVLGSRTANLSVLRNLRLFRLARVAKICRYFPELQTMINSMVSAMRSVLMTALTLILLTYCFALLLRQLGGQTGFGEEYFSSVPLSMYNLLILSILPDHEKILTDIGVEVWYCGVVYFLFLLFSVLMVMNMLIAILCDGISNESASGKDQRALDAMTMKLRKILKSIDLDSDDLVSQQEFDSIITNAEAVGLLADVGIDVVALAEESDLIFGLRGGGRLPFEVFKEEVLKFRSNNFATLGSITATRRYIRTGLEFISHKLDNLEDQFHREKSTGLLGPQQHI